MIASFLLQISIDFPPIFLQFCCAKHITFFLLLQPEYTRLQTDSTIINDNIELVNCVNMSLVNGKRTERSTYSMCVDLVDI